VTLSGFGIDAITTDISFDVRSFDFADPTQLTVYHRPGTGQGVFTPLPTSYDSDTRQLAVTDVPFGEFIFTYPDALEVPLQPILQTPEDLGVVNQAQSVVLDWTSRGFARSFKLQAATDAEFNDLVADASGLTETGYTLDTVAPGTTYYWRVNTSNYGGTGEWATRSFTAVAPMIQIAAPNGGEQWQRGLEYFIRWDDNLAEDLVIELYKGDALVQTIAEVPSIGAYEWEVGLDLEPGDDYSIKIKGSLDDGIFGQSAGVFSIE